MSKATKQNGTVGDEARERGPMILFSISYLLSRAIHSQAIANK